MRDDARERAVVTSILRHSTARPLEQDHHQKRHHQRRLLALDEQGHRTFDQCRAGLGQADAAPGALQQLRALLPSFEQVSMLSVGDALRAIKVNPQTFQLDNAGVTVTPGHLFRALRRLAKLDGAPALARYPLTVDRDLAIG